jgi:hypothetical protein
VLLACVEDVVGVLALLAATDVELELPPHPFRTRSAPTAADIASPDMIRLPRVSSVTIGDCARRGHGIGGMPSRRSCPQLFPARSNSLGAAMSIT